MQAIEVTKNELVKITESSGLEDTKRKSYASEFTPFTKLIDDVSGRAAMLDRENPTDADVKIARALRLSLVPNRKDAERKKDTLKASMIIENRLIDSLFGVINNGSKLVENQLEQIEKFAEIRESARKKELKNKRMAALSEYEADASFYDLENMTDEAFAIVFSGIKKAHDDKIEAAKKEEAARVAKQKADEAERKRLNAENEKLRAEAKERERLQEAERKKQEKILQAEKDAKAKIENQLKKEREEKERKEKEEAEKIRVENLKKEVENEKRLSASDSEKAAQLAKDILALKIPAMSSREYKQIVSGIEFDIKNMVKKLKGK